MKVTWKDEKKPTEFKALSEGAVFEYEGEAYVKALDLRAQEYKGVDLEGGAICYFIADTEVMPLDAELIIRGELE